MKKERTLIIIVTIFSILLLSTIVQANLKTSRSSYDSGSSVFVSSSIPSNDFLCDEEEPEPNVNLFIVEHKDEWTIGDNIQDVRGNPTQVSNSRFSNKKVWEDSEIGTYDLIIDCNKNNEYDEGDILNNDGFSINPDKGTASITLGSLSPSNITWRYDSENPDLVIELLQLKLSATNEDIDLTNLSITIDSPEPTILLEVHVDKNNDGLLNSGDVLIGNLEYSNLNKIMPLDYTFNDGDDENILFIINMIEDIAVGEYKLKAISLLGIGVESNRIIKFMGTPIESNTLKVLNKKTCVGELELILDPNPTFSEGTVTASIDGLQGCNGEKVSIRASDCGSALFKEVDTCTFDNDICEVQIKAIPGRYFACIDKNTDGDSKDEGETDSQELLIEARLRPKNPINESAQPNDTIEELKQIKNLITGSVSQQDYQQQIPINNNLLILVEVTMLLILFVLILIFFKLREGSIGFKQVQQNEPNTILEIKDDTKDLIEDKQTEEKKEEEESIEEKTDESKEQNDDNNKSEELEDIKKDKEDIFY